MRKAVWIVVGVVVGVAVLLTGGVWLYINVIRGEPPAPLTLDDATTTTLADDEGAGDAETTTAAAPTTAPTTDPAPAATDAAVAAGGADGTWVATDASVVGYRVPEILFGQTTEGVGRTSEVTGSVTIDAAVVTAADFTVDMTTVVSDEGRRDGQFNGRLLDTSTYPTATFTLTEPIALGGPPVVGETVTATATGELTLRGTTRPVTFGVEARWTGETLEVLGAVEIVFEEWAIPDPSLPGISVEPQGLLEILLVLAPA